jgi:hypothetical protein
MQRELAGREERMIRIYTIHGPFEGLLHTSPGVSTMHYLNVMATTQNYLILEPPLVCAHDWLTKDAGLAIAIESILFVVELSEFVPKPGDPHEAALFKRAPVRMRLADFVVDGYVHVAPGADPIARLNQDRHPFVAMTAVTAIGPHEECTVPFMAVASRYIAAIQRIAQEFDLVDEVHAVDRAESRPGV